jgi:hypothetical protein
MPVKDACGILRLSSLAATVVAIALGLFIQAAANWVAFLPEALVGLVNSSLRTKCP